MYNKAIIGNCTLYQGDAYEIMPTLGHVGALVTDPPYKFNASGGGKFRAARKCVDAIQDAGLDVGFDTSILCPVFRFESCVVFCHNDQLPELLSFIKANYDRFAVLSYHKTNPTPVRNKHYLPDTEFFIHAWNSGAHPVGKHEDMKRFFLGKNGQDREVNHPTPKLIPLMQKIVRNVNSDLICDPFMGSGSTAIACIKEGKKFIGIEKNPEFFSEAVSRIEKEVRNV